MRINIYTCGILVGSFLSYIAMDSSKNGKRYEDCDLMQKTPIIRNMINGVSEKLRFSKFSSLNIETPGSPKRWYLSSKLQGVISEKTVILDSILVPDSSKLFD